MITKNKSFLIFLSLMFWFFAFNSVKAYEPIYTDDVKIRVNNNNPYNIEIIVNWQNLPKNNFQYYKISHSIYNPKIVYPNDMIWYTNDINDKIAIDNFSNYKPDFSWVQNYYRACVITSDKMFCSKADYWIAYRKTLDISEIKTFLRNNNDALTYISTNDYLKNKLNITTFDKAQLAVILSNYDETKYEKFKEYINLVTKDIYISWKISTLTTIYDIDNLIDLTNRSISKLWNYTLNNKNLIKLEALKKQINNETNQKQEIINSQNTQTSQPTKTSDDETNTQIVNSKIASIVSQSNQILSWIDLNYSNRIWSQIETIRGTSSNISDNIWFSFSLSKDDDLTKTLEKLQEMKNEIKEKMSENKNVMTSSWLTQSDKEKIQTENDKLQSSMDQIDELIKKIDELEKEKAQIIYKNIKLSLLVIVLIFIIILVLIFKFKNRKIIVEWKWSNNKVLQIIKNWNEYSVDFDGIYNKWVKVLESTKNSIKNWVENYVRSTNILNNTRWFLDDLEKLDIEIPDLSSSWNTIFKLFLNDEMKEKINNQNYDLIIKTDEQELPWEIMHNWQTFLSLKFPIARQIMTREKIKQTKISINKIPKMLFIVNPTNDLSETEKEVENIIKKISSKADIKVLKWNNANLINVIWELSKDNYDVIHYSGHSYFDNEKPDEWWLILANWEILSNTEIKRLIEWNPLIFLNACSSGKSISDNEEFYKNTWEDTIWLATSFYIGWAKWVISAMWPINDEKASFFAINFYLKFLSLNSIWESILYAKKETYIKDTKDSTWASFIYYWDPDLKINIK